MRDHQVLRLFAAHLMLRGRGMGRGAVRRTVRTGDVSLGLAALSMLSWVALPTWELTVLAWLMTGRGPGAVLIRWDAGSPHMRPRTTS